MSGLLLAPDLDVSEPGEMAGSNRYMVAGIDLWEGRSKTLLGLRSKSLKLEVGLLKSDWVMGPLHML